LGLTWQVAVEGEPQVGGAPVAPPSGLPAAQSTLEELRLLVRLDLEGEPPKYVVPRWVRPLLLERMSDPERTESHRRAARYWRWQGDADSRTLSLGVEALLEARFHHDAAGELELAVAATTAAGLHHLRGSAWGRLDRLCRETLSWVPPDSLPAARFYHMLGLSAARQGEYASAIEHYQRALDINNRHSVRAVLAASYHQLGLVAEERGEQGEALSWYGKALEVEQEVGDLAGQADTCLRLGWIDRERGDDEAARRWYQRALQVLRDLGDEPLIMATLNHLGQLAGDHGDWTQATAWYGEVLDSRRLWSDGQDMVANFHLLGLAAQDRGDYGEAFLWYRQALDVEDSRGYRPGVAFSYRRLGRIAELCGDLDGALDWYRRSLVVEVEQGLQAHLARTSFRIAVLVSELGKFEEALPLAFRALLLAQSLDQSITVELEMLKHLRRQLGARTFFTLLDPHLDAQNVEDVLNLLDE
jgi:tetratricopeptide (TPR) repeat protein